MTPQAHLPVWMELEQHVNIMLTGGSEFFTYKHIYLMSWVGGLHCYRYWWRAIPMDLDVTNWIEYKLKLVA